VVIQKNWQELIKPNKLEVGDVLAHARDRGELVQHAVDLDGGDGRALERRQESWREVRTWSFRRTGKS
jgi:hypothetical protein